MEDDMKFIESPYFVPEMNNWHLKEGAPQEVIDDFNKFMEWRRELKEKGRDD